MQARWTLTPDDLLDAQFATPQSRAANRNASLIWCVGIFALAYEFRGPWWLALLLGLAGAAVVPFLRRYPMRSTFVRSLAGKEPHELEMDYAFSDTGYRAKSFGATSEVGWSALHGWVEGPKTIAFLTSEVGMEVIPKRALSDDDLESLRGLLCERVRTRQVKHKLDAWSVILWIMTIAIVALTAWSFYSSRRH